MSERGPSPAPPPPDTSGSPDTESFLDRTRDALASEGVHESTHMRPGADLEKPLVVEEAYQREETKRILEGIDTDREKHPEWTKERLIREAAKRSVDGRTHLAQADVDALRAQKAGEGRSWAVRAVDKYRHSTKVRVGIAVASGLGAAGLAASGLWMPALGVKLASGALRGAATYLSAREGTEFVAGKLQSRTEKEGGAGLEKGIRLPEESKPEDMLEHAKRLAAENPKAIPAMLARLQSPHVSERWTGEQAKIAREWVSALREAEIQRVEAQFKAVLTEHKDGKYLFYKDHLPERLQPKITEFLSESLDYRRKQINADKQSLRWKKGAALALATLAGASGVAGFLTHVAEHGSHIASGAANPHGAEVGPSITHAAEHVPHHLKDFEFTAHSGDSFWSAGESAVHHALNTVPEWHHLGSGEHGHVRRLIANDYIKDWLLKTHGGNSLVMTGEHIKVPKEVLHNALEYAKNYKL